MKMPCLSVIVIGMDPINPSTQISQAHSCIGSEFPVIKNVTAQIQHGDIILIIGGKESLYSCITLVIPYPLAFNMPELDLLIFRSICAFPLFFFISSRSARRCGCLFWEKQICQ